MDCCCRWKTKKEKTQWLISLFISVARDPTSKSAHILFGASFCYVAGRFLHFWPFYVWKWFAQTSHIISFFPDVFCFNFHGALRDAWNTSKKKWILEIWCRSNSLTLTVNTRSKSYMSTEEGCMKKMTACFYLLRGLLSLYDLLYVIAHFNQNGSTLLGNCSRAVILETLLYL